MFLSMTNQREKLQQKVLGSVCRYLLLDLATFAGAMYRWNRDTPFIAVELFGLGHVYGGVGASWLPAGATPLAACLTLAAE